MAGEERIAELATYFASKSSAHVAAAVCRVQREHPDLDGAASIIADAHRTARHDVDWETVIKLLGSGMDYWSTEAAVAAAVLCRDAVSEAIGDRRIWDRRRTTKTCTALLNEISNQYINMWRDYRGIPRSEGAVN